MNWPQLLGCGGRMRKFYKPFVFVTIFLLLATWAKAQEQGGRSTIAPGSSLRTVPCEARANAVVANTGAVSMDEQSLVDSYQSERGPYGHGIEGNRGSH